MKRATNAVERMRISQNFIEPYLEPRRAGPPRVGDRPVFRRPWIVFLLFAINGPAIDLFGQLRFSELAILIVAVLNVSLVIRSIKKTEWKFGKLFALSAFAYLLMDQLNQGIDTSTISRFGTYLILCLLLFSMNWMIGDSKKQLVAALAGYSLSFIVVLILNLPVPSTVYHELPWRLGLGAAVTLLVCVIIYNFPRLYIVGLIAIGALIPIHLLLGSRTLGALTLVVFVVSAWTYMFGSHSPKAVRTESLIRLLVLAGVGALGIYGLMVFAVDLSVLPDELQRKFEGQLQNSYGLAAAARPDTAAAIYGISKRPITGYGSSTVDPDVYAFYAQLGAMNYSTEEDQVYKSLLEREWLQGNPSHSHIFGAWVDAGVVAAVSWMVVLGLCVRVLMQVVNYRSAITPLATLVAVLLLWDVLFSPGPIRLTVALSLTVLLFVDRLLTREMNRQ